MFLDDQDLSRLIAWRRKLHQRPEVSGEEKETAREVRAFMAALEPDLILTELGGHGVAVVYDGAEPGPTVHFRSEIDALPIEESSEAPHRSRIEGRGHLCGHDGHTAILAALGTGLMRERPKRGRAVLLFQPAEETGAGAAAVIADPKFAGIRPDYAFSLHNLPGLPLGAVTLKEGAVNCASMGMRIVLSGKTAHASMPQDGLSPMAALARLMPALTALGAGGALGEDFTLVTVTHARMGEPAFGIAPGKAEIWITLRTLRDAPMAVLRDGAERLVREEAQRAKLEYAISYHDVFRHCDNHPDAVAHLRQALDTIGVPHRPGEPMYPSEDFGRFGDVAKSAMFFLGAGTDHPRLHNPDYDFPDDLIAVGSKVFMQTLRDLLG